MITLSSLGSLAERGNAIPVNAALLVLALGLGGLVLATWLAGFQRASLHRRGASLTPE